MDKQARYLQQRAIANKDLDRCCDCLGGNVCPDTKHPCQGFQRDCRCDHDLSFLPWRKMERGID